MFFNGQIAYSNGNAFIETTIIDGVFNENVAVDIAESELLLFLTGNPTEPDGFLVLNGGYLLQSVVDPEFGEVIRTFAAFRAAGLPAPNFQGAPMPR